MMDRKPSFFYYITQHKDVAIIFPFKGIEIVFGIEDNIVWSLIYQLSFFLFNFYCKKTSFISK